MVVIQVKKSETEQFLFETTTSESNDALIRELCRVHNLREKLMRLGGMVEELARYGPSKSEADRGIDEIQERDGRVIVKGPHYVADPLGNRCGNAPPPGLVEVLLRTAADGTEACSKNLAARGVALTTRGLQEKVDNIRGAVAMAWPMGLPDWDPVRLLIEAPEGDPAGFLAEVSGADFMDPATTSLWLAGKEFFRDKTVGDRCGRNEKTKVIAKLTRPGGGAPAREPAVSEDERRAMMAWYMKKQEEQKALVEDNEEGYLDAKWADPKALKSALLGTGDVGWRAGGGGRR